MVWAAAFPPSGPKAQHPIERTIRLNKTGRGLYLPPLPRRQPQSSSTPDPSTAAQPTTESATTFLSDGASAGTTACRQ